VVTHSDKLSIKTVNSCRKISISIIEYCNIEMRIIIMYDNFCIYINSHDIMLVLAYESYRHKCMHAHTCTFMYPCTYTHVWWLTLIDV